MEVMVPELQVRPTLLGQARLDQVQVQCQIDPDHPDEQARADGYWFAYIVKGRKSTKVRVSLRLSAPAPTPVAALLDTLWLDIDWINYGPFGRLQRRDGVLIP
jgi:hypothetical protein